MFRFQQVIACLILLTTVLQTMAADESQKVSSESLHNDQLAVTGRYERFERLLSQMADILGHDDPERAELLRRAISKGREQAISEQLGQIADELERGSLGKAIEQQGRVLESLATLLTLLQSEDRRSELDKERERLNQLLKDVSNTLGQQRSARANTQNATAPSSSAPSQQKAIDRADKILKDIRNHDSQRQEEGSENAATDESAPQDSSDNPSEDSPAGGDQDPSESEDGSEANASASDTESSSSNTDPSQDSESQNSAAQSQNEGSESQSKQTPGANNVAQARRAMEEALEQLQQQLRDKALEKQDDAIEALQEAVEELRKRLLQLREEEKEMILQSLEARFQRMLAQETQIYDETIDLNATPVDNWLDDMFAHSRKVAQQQAELQVECDQTLGLLKEDGTSVAIVLSVEDISIDMRSIARRLREYKVGPLTQSLETDIVEALKELIEATQREMQEMKSEERQEQAQSAEQQKPPLVQLIAEIKVMRSLQVRINRRTQRLDQLMAEASAEDRRDLFQQLDELTTRQQRLVESAAALAERVSR